MFSSFLIIFLSLGNCFANVGSTFLCATNDEATGAGGANCGGFDCGGPQLSEDCAAQPSTITCQQVLADRCSVPTPGICVSPQGE